MSIIRIVVFECVKCHVTEQTTLTVNSNVEAFADQEERECLRALARSHANDCAKENSR